MEILVCMYMKLVTMPITPKGLPVGLVTVSAQ